MTHRQLVLGAALLNLISYADASPWQQRINTNVGYLAQSDRDLGLYNSEQRQNGYLQLNVQSQYQLSPKQYLFSKVRAFYSTASINLEPEEGGQVSKHYLELQQLYVKTNNLVYPGLSTTLGRKRLRDDSGLWWDRNFTLASLNIERSLFNAFIAIGEQLNSFRTDNSDYKHQDHDLFRVMASSSWHWSYQHFIDINFSHLNDHGERNIESNNLLNGAKVSWLGLRPHGFSQVSEDMSINYSAQYILQQGGVNQGRGHKDVSAWLFQADALAQFDYQYRPVFGVQFAQTSNNNDAQTEGRFFQNGLHSNRAVLVPGMRSHNRYNDAYRPELSNIRILGANLGLQLLPRLELNVLLNQFTRLNTSFDIGHSAIDAPLIDGQDELGLAADLVVAFTPALTGSAFDNSAIQLRLSGFWPGAAYGEQIESQRYRALLDWRFNF